MSLRLVLPPEREGAGSGRRWRRGSGAPGVGRAAVAAVSEGTPRDGLHARLERLVGGLSNAEVARRTGVHSESVRRYRRGAEPSARFLAAVCEAFGVSGDWLLCGRGEISAGPEREGEQRAGAGG